MWQLVIGGLLMAVVGMLAGIRIAGITFSIWIPGVFR
jgi:hypothetical protein